MIATTQAHGMPIQTKVDLIRAKIDILKLKANDHDWCCYVPDDVKKSLNATLAEINKELEAINTSEPIEFEWNLYHDMDNRSYNDVARIKELEAEKDKLEQALIRKSGG